MLHKHTLYQCMQIALSKALPITTTSIELLFINRSWLESQANLLFILIIGPCYVSLSSLFVDPPPNTYTYTACLCDTKRIQKTPETVSAWKGSHPNGSCIQSGPPVDLPYIDREEWWRPFTEYETERCDIVLTLPECYTKYYTPHRFLWNGNFPLLWLWSDCARGLCKAHFQTLKVNKQAVFWKEWSNVLNVDVVWKSNHCG